MKKRCVIVAASNISNYTFVSKFLNQDSDYYIVVDGGLKHCSLLGIKPNLIVGDFDSYPNFNVKDYKGVDVITLSPAKDDTDSFYAAKYALSKGFDDFLFIGAVGDRFDHSLVNISILSFLIEKECRVKIIDDYSVIRMLKSNDEVVVDDNCKFFSTLAINGNADGVNITGAKYPLDNGLITCSFQYGVSNEPIKGKEVKVKIKKGFLLLIEVYN